ncbi:MAG: FixJ family two-component response regulator [Pseudohongiellaceae bacterium]|jgi:FixJ family two-component response regulator
MNSIYILSSDTPLLESLNTLFSRAGFVVTLFLEPQSLLERLVEEQPNCILAEGLSLKTANKLLIENIHDKAPNLPIVMVAAGDDISVAVEAIRNGAIDFVQKPIIDRVLIECVKKVILKPDKSMRSWRPIDPS